MLVTAYRF